jgi:hypothetical protein
MAIFYANTKLHSRYTKLYEISNSQGDEDEEEIITILDIIHRPVFYLKLS